MGNKADRTEEAIKLGKQTIDLEMIDKLESQVIDNTIEFEIVEGEGMRYRVRMPTIREKMEINRCRLLEAKRLQDQGFLYEAELVEQLYEKQGIDIVKMDKAIVSLTAEIEKLQIKLTPEPNKDHRERIKNMIMELQTDRVFYISQKSSYLETSMEAQLTDLMMAHFASLIFENKTEANTWVRVFQSYDNYIDSQEDVVVTAAVNYTYKLLF